MNILRIAYVLIIICLYNNISFAQESKVDTTKTITLRIDPKVANGGSMSQVFDEIQFIPLQTTKESIFGDITQLEVTENEYVIFDNDTKAILIFDKKGIYKCKLNLIKVLGGKVSSQDVDIYGFTLINKNQQPLIEFSTKTRKFVFSINGKKIDEYKIAPINSYAAQEFTFNDSSKVMSYYKDLNSNDKSLYQYVIKRNNKIAYKYFEIDTGKYYKSGEFAVGGKSLIETDNPEIFNAVRSYDYNIYQISKEGISIAYRLIFPSVYTIPFDFNSNKKYLGKKLDFFFKFPKNIFGIGYTYKIGNNLYFKCGSLHPDIRKNGSFVYNLTNNYLISLNRLDIDSSSGYLPVIGRWDNDFKKFDGEFLYCSLSSIELFSYYEQEKTKNYKYPIAMQEYFNKGSKKDNPVIIRIKPKKDL
ncbi:MULTISPECIES: 6-bladed beta-propeller [Sphingobacterium]|uniref:6-bladed beta-propeller n=1 Tax=Sphingobacterium TaxID=28453 RepID=UPI00257C635A|nr:MULTISPECIES: 6-bladed beta-propeller [Sphingobacterium]